MKINTNLKNIISLFSIDFISKLISFAAVSYIARVLGAENFGLINIAIAVLGYAMIFGSSGLNIIGTKRIAEKIKNYEAFTGNILLTKLFISLVVYVIAAVIGYIFISDEQSITLLLVYNLFLFPSAMLMEWFFQGHQKMDIISFGRIAGMLAYLLFVISFVQDSGDTVLTGIGWFIGGLVNTLFLFYLFRRNKYSLKFNIKNFNLLPLVKESFSLGIASLIAQFVVAFPIIYLGFFSTAIDAGIFSAAFRIIAFLLVIDRVFNVIFFPKIIKCFNETPERLEEIFNIVLRIISVMSLSLSILIILASDLMTTAIFGDKFTGAAFILQLLTGYFSLSIISSAFTYTLISMNKENDYTTALFWSMIIFLIIIFSFTGIMISAISLVVFQFITLVLMYLKLVKVIRIHFLRSVLLPLVITVMLVALIAYLKIDLIIMFPLAVIVGVPLLMMAGGININDFRFLKRIFT